MSDQIARTKIIPPKRRADLLSRPRLLNTLQELLDFKFIILIAPAGYGKTFLMVDFAHSSELPVCWYTLDSLDRDSHRFFSHFIAAITEQYPNFGRAANAALESMANGNDTVDQLVTTLVNELYQHVNEHFVFVLDDFYLVEENPDISYFISQFLQQVDENCHLILASRKLLSIPDMALMIGRGYVGGIDFEDLAFERTELQALTAANYGYTMPDDEAQMLIDATDGWIIGLLLSAQSKLRSISGRMRLMRASGIDLYDYLAEQVLNQQPPPIRDFLLRTSLLEEFDADLCEAIFLPQWLPPQSTWQSLISEVLRRNLFVLLLGQDHTWLRYNHVFQDFLQKRIQQSYPEEEKLLLERLVDFYHKRQEWEKAYYYLRRLGVPSAVIGLIEEAGFTLLYHGRTSLLESWLKEAPVEHKGERPVLLALQGALIARHSDAKQGLPYLNQAVQIFQQQRDMTGLAHVLVLRAIVYRLLGDYLSALADAEEAIHLLDKPVELNPTLEQVRVQALRSKGLILYYIGKPQQGLDYLQAALTAYQTMNEPYRAASTLQDIALNYLRLGEYANALTLFQQVVDAWRAHNNISGQARVLNNLGFLHHLLGDYEQALIDLEEALDCAQRSGYTRMIGYALLSMGDLMSDLDLWDAAGALYAQALPNAKQSNEQFLVLYFELAQSRLAAAHEDWQQVFTHLDNASRLVMEKASEYEWGLYQLTVGRSHLAQRKTNAAIAPLEDALAHFSRGHQPIEEASTHFLLAAAYHTEKQECTASHHLRQGLALAYPLESRQPLLPLLRSISSYLEQRQANAADPRVRQLRQEIESFEQSIPKLSRRLRRTASAKLAHLLTDHSKFIIRTLGRVEITIEGQSVSSSDWQTIISRDLFLCLLAHPEGLTKEQIGAIFWADASPTELKTRFKNAIYRLRNALRQEVVVFTNDIYHFNWSIDYTYDVEEFLQHVAQGDKTTNSTERIKFYKAALQIYGGSYLPDVDANWARSTREHLRQVFYETGLALAELYFKRGDYHATLDTCRQILNDDPCMEEAHRLAMRSHAALGNRAAVARQYTMCQQALLVEVDASPSLQTTQLYTTLMHE
ncbi:MAG: tetratricopeptide repeat protein [Caldilineaceae bacterium]